MQNIFMAKLSIEIEEDFYMILNVADKFIKNTSSKLNPA
jgi:hypothetical protein